MTAAERWEDAGSAYGGRRRPGAFRVRRRFDAGLCFSRPVTIRRRGARPSSSAG